MLVEIFHNDNPRDSMTYGFRPTDTIVKVAEYPVRVRREDMAVLEDAFERFNVGEDEIAAAYRAAGHRSLSKGDVVVLTFNQRRRAYACASFGWDELTEPLHIASGFKCQRCREEFPSDSARYAHKEATGHDLASLWY